MRTKLLIIAATALATAACAPVDVGLGESVHYHMAAQTIDPHPKQETDLVEGGSGQRAADAVQRYREGKVKEPRAIATATNRAASGGGGMGAGPQ